MAPITCKVTDITNVGLRGLHVVLDCFDQCQNPLAKFESFTDHNGLINSWLPAPQAGESSVISPQDVDAHSYPRVSLTFFPGPYHTANGAWVSIRTDLYLLGIDQHHIVLRINDAASYHLEHHKISSNPPASSNVDADLFADISSPSRQEAQQAYVSTHTRNSLWQAAAAQSEKEVEIL
ncbi:unnamed protein product [Clonostachys chloroleuca]|uniref:Uncharacterized protein n=1 Tax=Clonostachys chloroleuca TaxID=1926264 RepID=A0AA35M7C4_9HYPO|nr:unnamed protein product [Clonostachys chloroleuca]